MGLVPVRLVPRNRQGGMLPANLFSAAPSTVKALGSDPERAREALGTAFGLGIQSLTVSQRNTLDGLVPSEQFSTLFGVELTSDWKESGQLYFKPTGELILPANLADTIAFAYVPTPPEYFAYSFTPPNARFHQLRLEDMARSLRAYPCHRQGWTGRGVRLAMADTGFFSHPFFEDYGFAVQRVNTPSTANPGEDADGHGTGESANALVVAPDCTFIGVKHDDYSAQALETCLAQNPQIVTNSWGWDMDDQSLESLRISNPNRYNETLDVANIIADAIADGVVMIFAGGNGQRAFPACLPEVIAVGGTTVLADGSLRASNYASSFLSELYPGRRVPDLCGIVGESGKTPQPGHIMLPVPNGSRLEGKNLPATASKKGWGVFSGTSAAAPQVAGTVALMLSIYPNLTPAEVKSILTATSRDVTRGKSAHGDTAHSGVDDATGSGLIDAYAACLRVRQLHP
jgi:serine protease AprX